jgi:hypothetical protein
LEGQFIENDDYAHWIKCAAVDDDIWTQQKMGKDDEPKVHLYHVQMIDDLAIEDGRWGQIKAKIKFDESLNEEQRN